MESQIIVLNQSGDETISWDPEDTAAVETAKKKWDELKKAGYRFYEAVESRGKEVKKFKPNLGKVIAAPIQRPAMAGGPVLTPR